MYVRRLELRQLRRHEELTIDLANRVNVVVGPNGAGKTTVLEAIDVLLSGSSFRASAVEQLVSRDHTEARIAGVAVVPPGRELSLAVQLRSTGRAKVQLLNDKTVRRHTDLHRVVARTSFTSIDLDLVRGSPSARRSFLDEAVSRLSPRGDQIVESYERAVRQRNALLKQLKGRADPEGLATLDVWDERLVTFGAELAQLRLAVLESTRATLTDSYNAISGSSADGLVAEYHHNTPPEELAAALGQSRQIDLLTGVTHVGPHRDDVHVRLGERNLRLLGSSGEQRSAVLAWKISTHRAVQEAWGITPVLLLDDVFSELDERRCRAVLREFGDGQVVISAVALPVGARVDNVISLTSDAQLPAGDG